MQSSNTVAPKPPHAQSRSFVACTLVYRDELPNAAVLSNSFRHFYPEADFVVLVIDAIADQAALPNAKILPFTDLGLDAGEQWRLPMLMKRRDLLSPHRIGQRLPREIIRDVCYARDSDDSRHRSS